MHNNNNKNTNTNNNTTCSSNNTAARVNTTQACAACKYQRRKCAADCILAPYFPHDRQRQFLNAHKLFGVSNITKIIRHLDLPEKDAAMRTIIFQSDVRATDPVGGCYRIIRQLQRQIEYTKVELDFVLHQLAICRAQAQAQHQHMLTPAGADGDDCTDSATINNCDLFNTADIPLGSFDQQLHVDYHHHDDHPPLEHYNIINIQNEDQENIVAFQEVMATNSWGMQGSTSSSMMMPSINGNQQQQQHCHSANECNNFKQLFDGISDHDHDDPHHEFIFESEELIHRSDERAVVKVEEAVGPDQEDESSFHFGRDHPSHHDLKAGAHALFTALTKCNT